MNQMEVIQITSEKDHYSLKSNSITNTSINYYIFICLHPNCFIYKKLTANSVLSPVNIHLSLSISTLTKPSKLPMKALVQKVNFRLKKNKTPTEQAILLNQNYSSNLRQLYQLLNQQNKLPKLKLIPHLQAELNKLKQNMNQQLELYKPYESRTLQKFLLQQNITNSYSLISIYEQKQNQISNIKQKINSTKKQTESKAQSTNKLQTIQLLKNHLEEQKARRLSCFSKIQKIKEQLQFQTKNLIENKITNFDQEIEFRKLEKTQHSSNQ